MNIARSFQTCIFRVNSELFELDNLVKNIFMNKFSGTDGSKGPETGVAAQWSFTGVRILSYEGSQKMPFPTVLVRTVFCDVESVPWCFLGYHHLYVHRHIKLYSHLDDTMTQLIG